MRYASSAGGRVITLLGGLLATVIASVAIPKLAIEGILEIKTQSILVGAMIVILVVGATLIIVRVAITGPVTIETSPMSISLRRGTVDARSWDRMSTRFSATVTRNGGNTVRALIVQTATGQEEIPLTWFSQKTFTALMADLAPQQVGAGPTVL